MNKPLFFLAMIVALMLCACAGNSSKPDAQQLTAQWQAHQDHLNSITSWKLNGRIGVATKEDSGTVSINWAQSPDDFFLQLIAPFGRGTLNIEPHPLGVKMIDHNGKEHVAANERGLIWLKTGWDIPVDQMKKWVLGAVGSRDNPTVRVNHEGQTLSFQQGKWSVSYHSYQRVVHLFDHPAGQLAGMAQQEISLPRKMTIESAGLKVKLVISQWEQLSNGR